MMRVAVLSSGSKGNTTYLEINEKKILIDVGNSCKYITTALLSIGVDINCIDYIFITHAHIDHIYGLKGVLKKCSAKVFMSLETSALLNDVIDGNIIDSEQFYLDDVIVDVIKTSHDIEGSLGFVFSKDSSLVYVTDTGYINKKYDDVLKNRDVYIMECNHDVELLQNSKYPFELRKRILSDKGHLSNYDAAKDLLKYVGPKTKYIFLAHLSEENNDPILALNTVRDKLGDSYLNNIIVTGQNVVSRVVEVDSIVMEQGVSR